MSVDGLTLKITLYNLCTTAPTTKINLEITDS